MKTYGMDKKTFSEDSKKAGGWYEPTRHTTGISNVLRRYKKIARRLAKSETKVEEGEST